MRRNLLKEVLIAIFVFVGIALLNLGCTKEDNDGERQPDNPADWKGIVTGPLTLNSSAIYNLSGMIRVKEGGVLTIPAGTRIRASGGTTAAIVVEQGGKIFVNGTAANPVVITSALTNPQRGDWGGIVICGRAPVNSGVGMSEVGDVPYGGTIANDISGGIRYLRIEYSGAAYNSEKEYNGLSLFGVGSGTLIEFVQIHECADDGIEFYGGTVSASNIVVSNVEDDKFDWTEGWVPATPCNFWFGQNAAGFGNRSIEGDNWETNHSATPFSYPIINNITLIGSGNQGTEPQGMELRRGTKGKMNNVVLKDWNIGIRVSGTVSSGWLGSDLMVTNVRFVNCNTKIVARNDNNVAVPVPAGTITENENATGAGNGAGVPAWAQGWTVGLQ